LPHRVRPKLEINSRLGKTHQVLALASSDETLSRTHETRLKQRASYPRQQSYRDGGHAILPRADLGLFLRPIPRRHACAGGRVMIELISAALALCSIAVFAAHALDAYRGMHS
jgi:hypothetical protein